MDWSVGYADGVVGLIFSLAKLIASAVFLYVVAVAVAYHQDRTVDLAKWLSAAPKVLAFCVVLTGLYVTYSVFRNQAQQNAEIELNNHGSDFVSWERSSPEIICLYEWHAYDEPDKCRRNILMDPIKYRNAMLYMEEAIFLLETARSDRERWGSRYAEDVKFWAEDISADPTGLFAYNLVSENDDPQDTARRAGLDMSRDHLCKGFASAIMDLRAIKTANIDPSIALNPQASCEQKLDREDASALATE